MVMGGVSWAGIGAMVSCIATTRCLHNTRRLNRVFMTNHFSVKKLILVVVKMLTFPIHLCCNQYLEKKKN